MEASFVGPPGSSAIDHRGIAGTDQGETLALVNPLTGTTVTRVALLWGVIQHGTVATLHQCCISPTHVRSGATWPLKHVQ